MLSYWRLDWGDYKDIESAIDRIQQNFPTAPIFGIGFSAGGHLLASYLQRTGKRSRLTAAVMNSAVHCFNKVSQ